MQINMGLEYLEKGKGKASVGGQRVQAVVASLDKEAMSRWRRGR